MGTLGEGLKSFNWITDRIDQASAWIKKAVRRGKVNEIDSAVDSRNSVDVDRLVRDIQKRRKDRTNAS